MVYVDEAEGLLRQVGIDLAEAERAREMEALTFWLSHRSKEEQHAVKALADFEGCHGHVPNDHDHALAASVLKSMPAALRDVYYQRRPELVRTLAEWEVSHGG